MIVLALLFASVAAQCNGTTCATCLGGGANCIYCDGGSFGLCQDKMVIANCSVGMDVGATCPDKCVNNTVVAKKCMIPSGWKVQSLDFCKGYNELDDSEPANETTTAGPTAAPDACSMALLANKKCATAIFSVGCSYGCQNCTDGSPASLSKLCKSTCDTLLADCSASDKTACSSSTSAFCAADETDCTKVEIKYVAPATTTASTAPTTAAAGGNTTTGATAATTAPLTKVDCDKATSCSQCAFSGCKYCNVGMTSETAGLGKCVASNATCDTMYTSAPITDMSKCIKDIETQCEKNAACDACIKDTKCVWCDTGAKVGVSTGSCSAGPTCKLSTTKPTMVCSSSTLTFALAAIATFVAALF